MTTTETRWTTLEETQGCAPGEMRTVKRAGHQLVVGRDESGAPFALDNRCPHEGYPLAQGDLSGCALTCCWHNWKFDVRDGSCTLGGEAVRHYPTRETDGVIEVDLADPAPETLWPKLLESFEEGVWKHENGRAIRDGVRLLQAGFGARRLAVEIARLDARYREYGTGHGLPVAADVLRMFDEGDEHRAMEALAIALDMVGDSIQRLPRRPLADPVAGGDERALRDAVEREDGPGAEALLLGMIDAGVTREESERLLLAVLTDHFLSFGHPLIYLVKSQELLAEAPREAWREVHAGLLWNIVHGTREDTLPYWVGHASRLAELGDDFDALATKEDADAPFDAAGFRAIVLDENTEKAFGAVDAALRAGVTHDRIARALVIAAAERLARFDRAVDANPELAETWLWATHRFTFAAAVRQAIERWDDPRRARFLFQCAAFVNLGRPMDGDAPLPEAAGDGRAATVIDAIARKDGDATVAAARACLADGGEGIDALEAAVHELLLSDPLVVPIFVAHAVKTALAGIEETRALHCDDGADLPLLASLRFLAGPHRERRVRDVVGTSIRWVVDGTMPAKLTQ